MWLILQVLLLSLYTNRPFKYRYIPSGGFGIGNSMIIHVYRSFEDSIKTQTGVYAVLCYPIVRVHGFKRSFDPSLSIKK